MEGGRNENDLRDRGKVERPKKKKKKREGKREEGRNGHKDIY